MSESHPEQLSHDAGDPSVHSLQTDIDLSASDYEPQPGVPVMASLVATIALVSLTVIFFFTRGPLVGAVVLVAALASGSLFRVLNRRYGAVDERNRQRFTERVDLARPLIKERFDFDIPADFVPAWTGTVEFPRSLVLGVITVDGQTVVLSAGPSPLLLVRFYPEG